MAHALLVAGELPYVSSIHRLAHNILVILSSIMPSFTYKCFRSLYFGVGRGLGGLLGAYLWEAIGPVYTFRLLGAVSASVAIFYTVAAFTFRAKKLRPTQPAEEDKF